MEYIHHLLGSLPPWAYVAIIGGGIAAAVILPKFFGGSQNSNGNSSGITDAIDPNTGLPYPLSGYPGGAFAGNAGQTTGNPADTAALLQALQLIASRLNPSPASGGTGTTKPSSGGNSGSAGSSTKKQKVNTTAPVSLSSSNLGTSAAVGAAYGATHVSAQPSALSIAAASGAAQAAQNQAAVVRRT
jgi:hypothetical protein